MTDRAWFDAAKGDIPQWAASMPKDADGTTIDWNWVRSLDLAHGVGTIPESTPRSIHDALKADYATRERLESIIAQCNSAFMTDFDRLIGSYRLPRALAYANRRLNDNINTMLHLGEQQHLWAVSRERRGRATIAVLKPYSGSGPSNDDQGMLDLSGKPVAHLPEILPPKTAMSSSPQQSPWTISKIVRRRFLTHAPNGVRPSASRSVRAMRRWPAPISPARLRRVVPLCRVVPPRPATLPDTIPSPTGATPICPAATWTR